MVFMLCTRAADMCGAESEALTVIAYLYGRETAEALRGRRMKVERNRDGRIKRVLVDGEVAFVLRNNDGYLLPTLHGARFLRTRVVLVSRAAALHARSGRNVPAKCVLGVPGDARPNCEVVVADPDGNIVAVGRLVYGIRELSLGRGYAIRVRRAAGDGAS